MYDLRNKVVLITGAANGIGAATCREVLNEGAKHVRILDVDENVGVKFQNELNSKHGPGKAKFVKCDVTDLDRLFVAFDNTKDEEGYLDVVVNNAGVNDESDYSAILKQIQINYTAVVMGTLKAVEMMDKRKGGRGGAVINISSIAGLYTVCPPFFLYSSTKSAVLQFTTCLGMDTFYDDTGIRTITMVYGGTDTNMYNTAATYESSRKEALNDILTTLPKQRIESAAQATTEAYKKGKSASIWLVCDDKSAIDITESTQKCHAEMAKLLAP